MEKTIKKNFSAIVIFALAICLIFAFAFAVSGAVAYADDTLEGEKVAEIKIGQMSDIHYFPLEYCYQNIAAEDFYSSDYYNSLTGDTKLVAESGAILTANITRIIEDAKVGKAPLYMFISGDNTKNGERVAEIDVANGLRYLQNAVRKFAGYENFQIFATVGNHDLYNGDGALYDKATGDAWDAEGIDTAQFALIYAGLGYPDASLDGSVGVKLKDFFAEEYWSSSFTNGYVQSSNSPAVEITYYNEHLQNVADGVGNAVEEYAKIGDGLNQLTFGAKVKNSGYNFIAFDTTDRVDAEKLIPIEIWKEQYDVLKVDASRTFYVSIDRKEFTFANDSTVQDAFATGKHVYVASLCDHLCGGRITLETFDWVESYLATISSDDELSTVTNLATFHHNIVPHFTQEDDILKDFTLYNWEYDAKRFIELGIRFTFAGHQHASDIETYTDAQGRSLTEFETGSGVSNDSPVRYFTISRYDVSGRLAETATSELHLLRDFKGMPSDKITSYLDARFGFNGTPYEFNKETFLPLNEKYQAAVTAYKNASAADKATKHAELQTALDNLLAANPDFYVQSMHYYELYTLGLTYNEYIYQEIYGQLVERILDHFLGDGTGLFNTVKGLIDTYLAPGNSVLDTIEILRQYSPVVYKMAVYIVNAVWYQLYPDADGNGYGDYVFDGVAYDNVIVFAKAIANDIVNLEFGTEEAGGKLTLAKMASAVLLTACNGNEPYSNLTLKGVSSFEDDFWYQDGTMYDEAFRVRYLAAMKDFAEQCDSGKLVDTLLNKLLTPIFYDENSLLKALLNYKFDFTSDYCKEVSGMTDKDIANIAKYKVDEDGEKQMISGLFKVLNVLLQSMFDAEELDLSENNFVLRDIINGAMPLVSTLLDQLLGFSVNGTDVIQILQDFIDDYLTDSFCVGLGGIAKNIVIAFGTDDSTDIADVKDPSVPYELEPCENYALIKDKDTQKTLKAFYIDDKEVSAAQNPATFENNRLPGTMTANFDTKNGTTEFTLSFYTDEEIFAGVKYRKVGESEWTTVSGDHWNIFDETARETKYATSGIYMDNLFGDVTVGNVNIQTVTAPAYIPLIDLGLLCITHGEVDYEEGDTTLYYTCRDRDNAPKNSVIYRNRHIVTISGLEANTTYEYDVFGEYYDTNGALKASNSLAESQGVNNFTFKTAADKSVKTFDFLAIADMQGMIQSMYDESATDIAKIVDKFDYDFVLNAGDMTDNGKNYYQWQYALNTNVKFFANTSAFNTAGNHESGTYAISNFYNYTQPNSVKFNAVGKAEQDYYSFDYGCAHVVVLDTNDASKDGLGATQLEWLKGDLEANKNAEVKFVLMHKSLYSTGSHTTDNDVVAMRAQLVPIFTEYGINVVFGGHDHVYCEAEVDGTLYVTLGTIGTKFYEYTNDSEEVAAKLNDNSINHTLTQRTFGYVKVEDGKVTYQGYTFDENGEIIEIKPADNGKDGLPAWAIALIAVGSVAVAAGIGVGVFFIIKKKKA